MWLIRRCLNVLLMIGCCMSWQVQAGPIIEGREWYQPVELLGFSFDDFNAVCAGGPCSGMVGGSGPDLTGWTWASIFEVGELFSATTPHPGGITEYIDPASVVPAFDFIGLGFDPTTPLQVAIDFGVTAVGGISSTLAGPGLAYFGGVSGNLFLSESAIGTDYTLPVDADDFFVGAWLYRAVSVPTPPSLLLFAAALVGLGWLRRGR